MSLTQRRRRHQGKTSGGFAPYPVRRRAGLTELTDEMTSVRSFQRESEAWRQAPTSRAFLQSAETRMHQCVNAASRGDVCGQSDALRGCDVTCAEPLRQLRAWFAGDSPLQNTDVRVTSWDASSTLTLGDNVQVRADASRGGALHEGAFYSAKLTFGSGPPALHTDRNESFEQVHRFAYAPDVERHWYGAILAPHADQPVTGSRTTLTMTLGGSWLLVPLTSLQHYVEYLWKVVTYVHRGRQTADARTSLAFTTGATRVLNLELSWNHEHGVWEYSMDLFAITDEGGVDLWGRKAGRVERRDFFTILTTSLTPAEDESVWAWLTRTYPYFSLQSHVTMTQQDGRLPLGALLPADLPPG